MKRDEYARQILSVPPLPVFDSDSIRANLTQVHAWSARDICTLFHKPKYPLVPERFAARRPSLDFFHGQTQDTISVLVNTKNPGDVWKDAQWHQFWCSK